MLSGLMALLTRALRMDARQMQNHLFRLAFVGFIYLCMLVATFQSAFVGAPGLSFFGQIAWLNAFFITCAGIGFFSSAITEEKEEETIGLLQMAGLNHLGILLGKSTSRLIQVVLLLIVQFPFMLLAVTLGGVTTLQIVAAYVDLVAYTILLANVALVCSVIFQRGGNAAAVTTVLMVLYVLIPLAATQELAALRSWGWGKTGWWRSCILTSLEWTEESCVFWQLSDVMATGFAKPIFTKQVISNITLGLFCFALSWLLFGPSVNNAAPGGVTRGATLKSTSRVKFLSPGRCWDYPLAWKDFHFLSGGYPLVVGKFVGYLSLFLGIELIAKVPTNWFGLTPIDVIPTFCTCAAVFLVLEACVSASRVFHEEIRLQTMSSLLMLPRSIPYIGYSKTVGCIMGLVPGMICLGFGLLQLPFAPGSSASMTLLIFNPQFWASVMTVLIFLHLIALLSLFIRWGALPAAFCLMGPVGMCCPIWQVLLWTNQRNGVGQMASDLPATITVWILTGLVCFVFEMMIAARLQELGTK